MKDEAMETVMVVKCIGCGNKREIKQGEIGDNDFPMCEKCYNPMFPERVIIRKKRNS